MKVHYERSRLYEMTGQFLLFSLSVVYQIKLIKKKESFVLSLFFFFFLIEIQRDLVTTQPNWGIVGQREANQGRAVSLLINACHQINIIFFFFFSLLIIALNFFFFNQNLCTLLDTSLRVHVEITKISFSYVLNDYFTRNRTWLHLTRQSDKSWIIFFCRKY